MCQPLFGCFDMNPFPMSCLSPVIILCPSPQLLFQEKNPGIRYQYTIQRESDRDNEIAPAEFFWQYGSWTKCTVTCGTGKNVASGCVFTMLSPPPRIVRGVPESLQLWPDKQGKKLVCVRSFEAIRSQRASPGWAEALLCGLLTTVASGSSELAQESPVDVGEPQRGHARCKEKLAGISNPGRGLGWGQQNQEQLPFPLQFEGNDCRACEKC